jgi:hypothetical protein
MPSLAQETQTARESGESESRGWRRWSEEDRGQVGRAPWAGVARYVRRENGHPRRREHSGPERGSEGGVVVTALASDRRLAQPQVVAIGIADRTAAGRVTTADLAVANVRERPTEGARERRKRARKRERENEREHENVPPSPPHGSHAAQHSVAIPGEPEEDRAQGSESAAVHAAASALPSNQLVMHTSRASPATTTVPPL